MYVLCKFQKKKRKVESLLNKEIMAKKFPNGGKVDRHPVLRSSKDPK
jgi:hypothetical protein